MSRTTTAGLVLLALVLAACGGPTTHIRPGTTASHDPWSGKTYVALGDSYTSGPEIGGAAARTGPAGCLQSDRNYPHLVAARLGLRLEDVSCSGAQTPHMTRPQDNPGGSVPPQFAALRRDTDLVTVSIGGNDFDVFMRIVGGCVVLAQQDPHGSPCTDQLASHAGWLTAYVTSLRGRLVAVLRGIRHRSPHARLLVVGYPQVIPAHGHCAGLPITRGDYGFAHTVNRAFDTALSGAARQVRATYVDTWAASAGHDICSAHPWIAGQVPAGAAAPYHPYAVEQRAVAALVERTLAS